MRRYRESDNGSGFTVEPQELNFNRVSTPSGHHRTLERAVEGATERVVIVSPFLSIRVLEFCVDGRPTIGQLLKKAVEKNISVKIVTDWRLDYDQTTGSLKENSKAAREFLQNVGAELIVKCGIHNKTIIRDDDLIAEGSFNWLSASREGGSRYSRYETTQVLHGPGVKKIVDRFLEELESIPTSNDP